MKHAIYPAIKWCARLSLLAALMLPALYCGAWRGGLIKFACMQEVTPSMQPHWAFMANPLLGPAIDTALGISCLAVVLMVTELKYGPRASAKIREALQEVVTRPYFWIPVIAFSFWGFFVNNPFMHACGFSWVIVGSLLIVIVLTSKQ